MLKKLTRWCQYAGGLEISYDGDLLDYDEVKELVDGREKKTEDLLKALEDIAEGTCKFGNDCLNLRRDGECDVCKARKAIEKYKTEESSQ